MFSGMTFRMSFSIFACCRMYWMDTWSSRETAWFKRLTYSGVVLTDMFPHVSLCEDMVEGIYIG
jgi:hypothetical protein